MPRYAYLLLLLLVNICSPLSALQKATAAIPSFKGQAFTLLSDGHILATGGFDDSGKELSDAYLVNSDGTSQKLTSGLLHARGFHSATALSDGTVLIFGGTDRAGNYLRVMELFNPQTEQFAPWNGLPLVPRASHTATLMTDGRVVVIGGTGEGGSFPEDIQFLDYRTGRVQALHVGPSLQRRGHSAILLADGTVLIQGGKDIHGLPVKQSEVYNPANQTFGFVTSNTAPIDDQKFSFSIEASDPTDGASAYPIEDYLKIRLSRLADVTSVNEQTVILKNANGTTISATVAAAEQGRLAFVIPDTSLEAGSDYTLTLQGITDSGSNLLPVTTIHFHTADDVDDGEGDGWFPDSAALAGDWGSRSGASDWEKLTQLHAPANVTALAGQALGLSGKPLAHVTLQIDSNAVETDSTGRFLLTKLSPGHHVLVINGQTANTRKATFGLFEAGVDIKAGITNVLPYTIWMTRLDTEHTVTIPSPTEASDTVISTPLLPGLEFHLPAHSTIVDRQGHKVTQLTITPIPLDKPPFPLPTGVKVPIYFTVQPGGSEISVQSSGSGASGARLYYPNTYNEPAGTVYNFWNYDAASKGWYIYGNGSVSADLKSIVPDPGVVVYELTGAMVGGTGAKPPVGGGSPDKDGDPVDLASGQFVYSKTDLAIADILPIQMSRTYITNDHYQRSFGIGTTCDYDIFMDGDNQNYQYQELIEPNGEAIRFNRTSSGTSWTNAVYASTSAQGPWYGATLTWVGFNQTIIPGADWILQTRTGMMYGFPEASAANDQVHQALTGIRDSNGNQIRLTRDGNDLLTKITSPSGRYISLTRDPLNRITQAMDNSGRSVSYTYDSAGHLATVTDVLGGVTSFAYNSNDQMTSITDAKKIMYLTNKYDSSGRVTQQTQADGSTYSFQWTPSTNVSQQWTISGSTSSSSGFRYTSGSYEGYTGLIASVSVTDPGGYVRQVIYNNLGMKTSETLASGQPEQQTSSYQYYADNLLQSFTDALGRTTSVDYDALGNLTRVTALAGTSGALTYTATYDQVHSGLLTKTDPLGHTWTLAYDANGNLTTAQDPLGHGVSLGYNPLGQPVSLTDAIGNITQFSYYNGTLTDITDPLGAQTTFYPDQLGRVVQTTNPDGASTQYQFDAADRLTNLTDAHGGQTALTYDLNDNLLTVQDPLNHVTQFSYDVMDRMIASKDPLLRTSSITYDLRGNPASFGDRKGQYTASSFDGIGRLVFRGYGATSSTSTTYSSTQSIKYDSGNRMTSLVDSLGGTVSRTFDALDRLTGETTPQGTMSYAYDNAGRRISAQAKGGTLIAYGYDNANRITSVTQGSTQVGITYDAANRRSTLTLPNGVTAQYGYDSDSRLQSISYAAKGTSLGNLSYVYDPAGRRMEVDGTLANTNLPAALTSATYDAANQLTSWAGIAPAYDADGNMTVDVNGNHYAWNSRNQLTGITGANSATFSYDGLGRRATKQIGSVATTFQYDGWNRIAETSAGATATLLPGALDEYFLRTDGNGAMVPVTDALGSTRGLVNSSGQVATSDWYDPYGNMTTTGSATANSTTYTGRESDGDGLLFYRARYYNPSTGRFIDEDPSGFAGGDVNLYRYVTDDPVNYVDPTGLFQEPIIIPPDLFDEAANLANPKQSLDLPDGGRLDLTGKPHFDPDTGQYVPTPHVHDPMPPYDPPYEAFPRGRFPVPRAATPDDFTRAIDHNKPGSIPLGGRKDIKQDIPKCYCI